MGMRETRRRLRWSPLALILAAVVLLLLLVGWNKVASSPRLCGSCHPMRPAVASADLSVHENVSCLACHVRPGLLGALRYLPSLAREGVAQVTGWGVARGILDPRSCKQCHERIAGPPEMAEAHAGEDSSCASCHGAVAHPVDEASPGPEEGHPPGYVQTHGRDVAESPQSCATCHRQDFCTACHFRTTFPHPKGWMAVHGRTQIQEGAEACTLCHPSTFCVGCHGTEIPHRSTWLSEHYRALQGASQAPCSVCHPRSDCMLCHARHDVHREQDLYR